MNSADLLNIFSKSSIKKTITWIEHCSDLV